MHVYFLETVGCKPAMMKIGKANNIAQRIGELQIGCPFELRLMGSIACQGEAQAYNIESGAHDAFRPYLARGEWFRLEEEVRLAVHGVLLGGCRIGRREMRRCVRQARRLRDLRDEDRLQESLRNQRAMDREFDAVMARAA